MTLSLSCSQATGPISHVPGLWAPLSRGPPAFSEAPVRPPVPAAPSSQACLQKHGEDDSGRRHSPGPRTAREDQQPFPQPGLLSVWPSGHRLAFPVAACSSINMVMRLSCRGLGSRDWTAPEGLRVDSGVSWSWAQAPTWKTLGRVSPSML